MENVLNNRFFASANSQNGFVSFFPKIFNPLLLDRIYIIKGGPGTGKSGLMKTLSAIAKEKGYTVEEFLCSSDPSSLDGIIIKEKGLAFLDGTAPHTTDPLYPGVVENIINTGSFWNSEILMEKKESVISLIQRKNRAYRRAYHFLKAGGEIRYELERIGCLAFNQDKFEDFFTRLVKNIRPEDKEYKEEIRLISAINQKGLIKLDSFEAASTKVFRILDVLGTGSILLERLLNHAREKQISVTVSYSCFNTNKLDALYFPNQSLTFCITDREENPEDEKKLYRYINMSRFVIKETIKENKQKIKFGKKCYETVLEGAIEAFADAGETHSELEKIFISAMDFASFNKMLKEYEDLI